MKLSSLIISYVKNPSEEVKQKIWDYVSNNDSVISIADELDVVKKVALKEEKNKELYNV